MIMGQMGEATPRGPSRASIEKDLQMKADFAENMGILEANLQKARGSVKALYAKLEEGGGPIKRL